MQSKQNWEDTFCFNIKHSDLLTAKATCIYNFTSVQNKDEARYRHGIAVCIIARSVFDNAVHNNTDDCISLTCILYCHKKNKIALTSGYLPTYYLATSYSLLLHIGDPPS